MQTPRRILVIGSEGQIGTELMWAIKNRWPEAFLVGADLKQRQQGSWHFELLDATKAKDVRACVADFKIDTVFLLAALLSATGEQNPDAAWSLNMGSLLEVLKMAGEGLVKQIFWPSSIAVFGPTTPRDSVPQHTTCEPETVYGISKYAGELWCQWYHKKYGVDVRSLRYPGLIGYNSMPGGGTTDYAVDIFHKAVNGEPFYCFLKPDTRLPMMFMPDAVRATLELMEAPAERLSTRMAYNIAAFSFTPAELAEHIRRYKRDFQIRYTPDYRQAIAETWPAVVDDAPARRDWGWTPRYTLESMVEEMLLQLEKKKTTSPEMGTML
jgi:nucleoside-diphosphate-sugar epimerase